MRKKKSSPYGPYLLPLFHPFLKCVVPPNHLGSMKNPPCLTEALPTLSSRAELTHTFLARAFCNGHSMFGITRLNIRPSATHNPHLRATHTRSTRQPQINAGAWGSVSINSRAKHPTINATSKEKGREKRENPIDIQQTHTHTHTCPPTSSIFQSALNTQRFQRQESSCQALACTFCVTFFHCPF